MTNPTMPNGMVPVTSPGGYGHDGLGGINRTEVEGGSNRYALDYDRGVQQHNVTIFLDALGFQVWNAFFVNIIKKGSITFDMKLDSGLGVADHACNIIPGSYDATAPDSVFWVVSFTVEAESQMFSLSEEESQDLVDLYNIYGSGIEALFNQLEQFATIDSNVLDF